MGPLLFLILINDIPSSVTCDIDLFADDSVLHHEIHVQTVHDCDLFQKNLESIKKQLV